MTFAADSVFLTNFRAAFSSRIAPRSISELIIAASRASILINTLGLRWTALTISACHTGRNRRLRIGFASNPPETSASRACMERPISRKTGVSMTISPTS
jgi:hypothetical protein